MTVTFETDWHTFMILPLVSIMQVQCPSPACEECHGWAFVLGWGCWAMVLHSDTDHPSNEQ